MSTRETSACKQGENVTRCLSEETSITRMPFPWHVNNKMNRNYSIQWTL